MNSSKVIPSKLSRNHSRKDPDRHRRAYEAQGQLWPENLRKHLIRAQQQERTQKLAERRVA